MITVCGRSATIACPHCSHNLTYIRTPTSHACRCCTYCGMPLAGKDIAHYYRPSGRSRCGSVRIGMRKFVMRSGHATDYRPATDDDPRCSRCRMWIEHDNQTQET